MPSINPKLVLIVDDEADDIEAVQRVLEATGQFRTVTATDYGEGMEAFQQHAEAIELALIDVALPGKNGVELAKRLLARKPSLHILFVSGHVGASVIRFYGINAADEHFLQKPFSEATLLRKVEVALASNQPLQLILSAASSGASEEDALDTGTPDESSGS